MLFTGCTQVALYDQSGLVAVPALYTEAAVIGAVGLVIEVKGRAVLLVVVL
jgi:hypothetical protein